MLFTAGFSSQALECIHLIQEKSKLPIERTRMRVRVTAPTEAAKRIKEQVQTGADTIEVDEMGEKEWETVSTRICVES